MLFKNNSDDFSVTSNSIVASSGNVWTSANTRYTHSGAVRWAWDRMNAQFMHSVPIEAMMLAAAYGPKGMYCVSVAEQSLSDGFVVKTTPELDDMFKSVHTTVPPEVTAHVSDMTAAPVEFVEAEPDVMGDDSA